MGDKYEVLYWDYYRSDYVSEGYTNSLLKALLMVRKLEKKWHCVAIKFRRNRVKPNTKLYIDVDTEEINNFTSSDFEED